MKLINLFFIFILAFFLLTGCAPKKEQPLPSDKLQSPFSPPALPTGTQKTGESLSTPTEIVAKPAYQREAADLIAKSSQVTSYHYLFQSRFLNSYGNYENKVAYRAYIKNNKTKKAYLDTIKLDQNSYYNDVYLDSSQEKAFGICSKLSVLCKPIQDKAYLIDYSKEKPEFTPLELIQSLDPKAKKVGEENFEHREVDILEYTDEKNQRVRLFVDRYRGLPVKRVISAYKDDEEIKLQEDTFTEMTLGDVKNADVNLPEKYVLS